MDAGGHNSPEGSAGDHPEQSSSTTVAPRKGKKGKVRNAALDKLTTILAQLDQEPDNVPILRQQITLLLQLKMIKEAYDAIELLSTLIMLDQSESHITFKLTR